MSLLSGTRLHYTSFSIPGDEAQTWTKEELVEMNARFTDRLEQAIALGLESRASAANQVRLPATSGAVQMTPLCPAVWEGLLRSAAASALVMVARR
jgi:hypothetical protein